MQSKTDWSYLAAMFDGEGCITGTRYPRDAGKYKYLQTELLMSIKNTSLTLMKWLISNFGGVYYTQEATGNQKTVYSWRPKGKKNKELILLGILPYLVIKPEQAKLGLEFLALPYGSTEKREQIVATLHKLNPRGKSVETNTLSSDVPEKIESELIGDYESAPVVIQVA